MSHRLKHKMFKLFCLLSYLRFLGNSHIYRISIE